MFEQDYIMRLIYEMIRTVLKLLFHIDIEKKEEIIFHEMETDEEYKDLIDLINEGKINEAENKLLGMLNPNNLEHYKLALMFYFYLNEKDIDFLEEHNYSKKEITEGLKAISRIYGHGSMADTLLNLLAD